MGGYFADDFNAFVLFLKNNNSHTCRILLEPTHPAPKSESPLHSRDATFPFQLPLRSSSFLNSLQEQAKPQIWFFCPSKTSEILQYKRGSTLSTLLIKRERKCKNIFFKCSQHVLSCPSTISPWWPLCQLVVPYLPSRLVLFNCEHVETPVEFFRGGLLVNL